MTSKKGVSISNLEEAYEIKKTIYIAGPMRGYHRYNFDAFHEADIALKGWGWDTINPAQADLDEGFCPDTPQHTLTKKDLEDFIVRDVHMVLSADAVVLLKGWEKSKGVAVEIAIAIYSDIPVYIYPGMQELDLDEPDLPIEVRQAEDILEEALRITKGDRQNQYGPVDQDFARTAKMWSALKGIEFSTTDIAMFQICIKLSRETHQKKRDNWTDIAGYARCGSLCGGDENG